MKKRTHKEAFDFRALERTALVQEQLEADGVTFPIKRRPGAMPPSPVVESDRALGHALDATAQPEFRITLLSRNHEKEHVRVRAPNLAAAKRHAIASLLASDTVIGVTVRPMGEE